MSFIFLSYAREDQKAAKLLCDILNKSGSSVWMDTKDLLPGERWDPTIRSTIESSSGAIFLASEHSLKKPTYIREELDALIEKANATAEYDIYLIVVRIDDAPIDDERLQPFHHVQLFRDGKPDYETLKKTIAASFRSVEHTERRSDRPKTQRATAASPKEEDYSLAPGTTERMFLPEELDIFVNKATKEAYIFHGKEILYDFTQLIYLPDDHSVIVQYPDGKILDLGVKIQWLVRPHFTVAREVNVVRTKDGQSIDGVVVPLAIAIRGTNGNFTWPSFFSKGMRLSPEDLRTIKIADDTLSDYNELKKLKRTAIGYGLAVLVVLTLAAIGLISVVTKLF